MHARGLTLATPLLALTALLTFVLFALAISSASASETHLFETSFGPGGTAATHFEQPAAVGVDESTGAIYVADYALGTVQKFNSAHEPEAFSPLAPNVNLEGKLTGFSFAFSQIAVNSASHDFYLANGQSSVLAYQSDGERAVFTAGPGAGTNEIGGFKELIGVAVDANGDIYASEYGFNTNKGVQVYASSGELLTSIPHETGANVAVDSHGVVYVNDLESRVEKFTPSVFPVTSSTTYTGSGVVDNNAAFGVAVDPVTNDLYVDEHSRVAQYDQGGVRVGSFGAAGAGALTASDGLAVNAASGRLYVSDTGGERQVGIFGPPAFEPGVTTGSAADKRPTSVTLNGVVNPESEALTGCHFEYVSAEVFNRERAVEVEARQLAGEAGQRAAEAGGRAAAAKARAEQFQTEGKKERAKEEEAEAGKEEATVKTEEATVKAEEARAREQKEGWANVEVAQCAQTPAQIGSGITPVAVSDEITGLAPGGEYHFRLAAANKVALVRGAGATFTTATPLKIDAAEASNPTATAVDLAAKINPENGDTTYRFEYGTSTSYGASIPVPDANIGEGSTDVAVTQHVEGLSPDVTYHWRVVASSVAGAITGADHTFVFPQTGGGLPDHRAYEMVTPPDKNAALLDDQFRGAPPVIAEDGSRVILGSVQCFGDAQSCPAVRRVVGSPYEFSRTAASWSATALAPPATEFATNSWWFFSADAGTALFTAPSAPHGEDDWYARQEDGSLLDIGPYSPPANAQNREALQESTTGAAATADLSHIVWPSNPVWPGSVGELGKGGASLFEYTPASSTEPVLLGVSGEGDANKDLIGRCKTELAGRQENAMSADGRTVYFNVKPCPAGTNANAGTPVTVEELYARVDSGEPAGHQPAGHTVAISEPLAPETLASTPADAACKQAECQQDIADESNWRSAQFWGASGDGSKAFFTSAQRLTDTATEDPNPADAQNTEECEKTIAGASGCNLYEYEGASEASGGHLVDVSVGDTSGHGPRVQGVMAVSSDGSDVYFVAKGVLSSAANEQGQSAQEEQDNLYVYERDAAHPAGRVAFITILPASDSSPAETQESGRTDWDNQEAQPNVTPDGRFLVFTSRGALTPDATRSDGARQVFRYDAEAGQLARVSIGQDGFNDNGNGGSGEASIVVAVTGFQRAGAGRPDPTMSNDGSRVFFMSPVALTRGALDSLQFGTCTKVVVEEGVHCSEGSRLLAQNVYEWERAGTPGGSCPEGALGGACVFLISDGHDAAFGLACGEPAFSATCLIGVDETGQNAFFMTADRLVPRDTDTQLDVYDARICTTGEPCIPSVTPTQPPCLGEACHGIPPARSPFVAGPTATFNGAGNIFPALSSIKKPPTNAQKLAKALKACSAKHSKHKRLTCEKSTRKRYGAKSKKAGSDRRAKR
jgi:hypothetical protein